MKSRPIYFADEIFYWARTGKKATVLEIQCTLVNAVEPQALKRALSGALRVHTNFRIRPVIFRSTFRATTEEVKNPPVFQEDGHTRKLGTSETNGLMLYVTYSGRIITLHIFHGLSDFRGIIAFLNTMLKFYLHDLGKLNIELPEADSADAIPCFENIIEGGSPGEPLGMFNPKDHDIFHIPEKKFDNLKTMHICEIDVPIAPLLALSKESESSVVPTIQAFIGRAIRKTYDVGEQIIIGYTPVDLRPIFNFVTSGNASSNFPVPYSKQMDSYELTERSMFLRSLLDIQIQPENLYAKVKATMESVKPVLGTLLPLWLKALIIDHAGRKIDRDNNTYGISYAGKVRFGEEIDPYVESVTACAGSYTYRVWILACEFNGILRLVFTQSFASEALVRNIYQ